MTQIAYAHTNLIARDWRSLAQFYIDVFGCEVVPPERDLSGEWIERMTVVPGVRVRGCHLRLPGPFAESAAGPDARDLLVRARRAGCRPADRSPRLRSPRVPRRRRRSRARDVEANGGARYGELVQHRYPELGLLTAVYAADPEGNVIEIQSWT